MCTFLNYIISHIWDILQTSLGGFAIYFAKKAWDTAREQLKEMNVQFQIETFLKNKIDNNTTILNLHDKMSKMIESDKDYNTFSNLIQKNVEANIIIDNQLAKLGMVNIDTDTFKTQ